MHLHAAIPSSSQGSGLVRCEPMVLSSVARFRIATGGPVAARSLGASCEDGVASRRPHSSQVLGRRRDSLWRLGVTPQARLPVQGFGRVLWRRERIRQTVKSRSQADDKELDSIEDLNIEDLDDEQLDELFENYGEIVKESPDPEPVSSEVDDDAESLAFAVALAEVANEVKAGEIQVLFVKPLVYWTRFFVIVTGFSRPQVDAIGKRMRDMAEERFNRTARGDLKPNTWTLLDFGDIVVHIFYPKERSFYNLEEFYGNATTIELPFKSESQVR